MTRRQICLRRTDMTAQMAWLAAALLLVASCSPAAEARTLSQTVAAAAAAPPDAASAAAPGPAYGYMAAMNASQIALASKGGANAAPAPAADSATGTGAPAGSGANDAASAGVPMDMKYLRNNPEVGDVVPLGPPKDDGNRFNIDTAFTGKKPSSAITGPAAASNARAAATPLKPITKSTGFIRTSGRRFTYGGKATFPAGTSWYNMLQTELYTEAQIDQMLRVHWDNGVRVLRVFGHSEGYGTSLPIKYPLQPRLGVFSNKALERYDYAVYAAGKVGIRLILTMTNFWDEYGGIQWYVNQTSGRGLAKERFYTETKPRSAFKAWLRTITQRTNTRSKRKYKDDPTIFAWELCNECHTNDNYEIRRGLQPGQLVYNWQVEMAGYLKTTLGVKSMVTNGNEGYRTAGRYDPFAPLTYPWRNWMNSGLKGEDFNRMLYNPHLDFATIHVYPYNLGIPAAQAAWVLDAVIGDRAALAAAANKPLLLEEYGGPRDYVPRDSLFKPQLAAAVKYGLAGSTAWEVWPRYGDDKSYDFGYTQAGGPTVLKELAFQKVRASTGTSPFASSFTCACSNNSPNATFTCPAVVAAGQCCSGQVQSGDPNNPFGFCQTSCGRCLCQGGNKWCPNARGASA